MKCFSLVADNFFVAPTMAGMHPAAGAHYVIDAYPKAAPGFDLDPTDRTLRVGFKERVSASDELLTLPAQSGAVKRDGRQVKVLRASVQMDGGVPVLVPEKPEDAGHALVYIGVGSGRHSFIRFQTDATQLVAHSRSDGEEGNEKVLVVLKPFESVVAVRSDKKYIFWGEERVKENLVISFDGENIFYNIQRVGKKDGRN